jgi:hypothetical protein
MYYLLTSYQLLLLLFRLRALLPIYGSAQHVSFSILLYQSFHDFNHLSHMVSHSVNPSFLWSASLSSFHIHVHHSSQFNSDNIRLIKILECITKLVISFVYTAESEKSSILRTYDWTRMRYRSISLFAYLCRARISLSIL